MFYTFLAPLHPIEVAAASFADGMFEMGVEKSVKKLDKQNYSYIMFCKRQAASGKRQAASGKRQAASGKRQAASKAAMLKPKDFIL
jgi:hypothetical protein